MFIYYPKRTSAFADASFHDTGSYALLFCHLIELGNYAELINAFNLRMNSSLERDSLTLLTSCPAFSFALPLVALADGPAEEAEEEDEEKEDESLPVLFLLCA